MATDTQAAGTQKAEPKKRAGFNDKGEAFPGTDVETGARLAVTFEGLQKEFGKVKGEEVYFEISRIGGHGITKQMAAESRPPLSLNMDKDARAQVDALLAKE
jgi:hypothetical protein